MRRQFQIVVFGIALLTCTHVSPTPAPIVGPTIIPLTVHNLTRDENKEKQMWEGVAWGSRALSPFDLGITVWEYVDDPIVKEGKRLKIHTGKDERLINRIQTDGTLYVFLVDDAKLGEKDVSGFAHRSERYRYFVLDSSADKTTMAHEIGHILGLEHLDSKDNVMSPGTKNSYATFTYSQGQTMRQYARYLMDMLRGS